MGRDDKKEDFLVDLGRATMRGVRRCKKCGTLNGTRGYACKNKNCLLIFKEAVEKKKVSYDPIKIDGGTDAQIYSVRVRVKGPDYRGFVQLPSSYQPGDMIDSNGAIISDPLDDINLLVNSGSAKCYVESCQRAMKYSVHQNTACQHLLATHGIYKEAQPLTLKNSALNSLYLTNSLRTQLYELATDTTGPLVQRVSKNIMVVKCMPDALHPLGFLHFSFIQGKNKKSNDYKFFCSCRAFKHQANPGDLSYRRCVHLFACIVAFASDDSLTDEFHYFIQLVKRGTPIYSTNMKEEDGETLSDVENVVDGDLCEEDANERSFLILNDNGSGTPCQVEVQVLRDDSDILEHLPMVDQKRISDQKVDLDLESEDGIQLHTTDGTTINVHHRTHSLSIGKMDEFLEVAKGKHIKKRKSDETDATTALLTLQKDGDPRRGESDFSVCLDSITESDASLSFSLWLCSAVERINQSMHYGMRGKDKPLLFHLTKDFFCCLLDRINFSVNLSKTKEVPIEKETFLRTDVVPLGVFTKYTWHLTSIDQVQRVFHNSSIALEITRYFEHCNGIYEAHKAPKISKDKLDSGKPQILPQEYKTELRVCPENPFTIQWIPDILPQSHIGELKLVFEFDYYSNGSVVTEVSNKVPLSMNRPGKTAKVNKTRVLAPKPISTQSIYHSITLPTSGINSDITLLTF